MGKISDAIEKAGKTGKGSSLGTKVEPFKMESGHSQSNVVSLSNELPSSKSNQLSPMLVANHFPDSIESEVFKILRTSILHPQEGKPPKTILVTSSMPGEGKSFVSSNFAISMAQGLDEHVLLVDCDIHKQNIPKLFGMKIPLGLSDYLLNGTPLEKMITTTPIQKLSILAGGSRRRNLSELLSSKKMADLLIEMKNRYQDRYIIIDTPPPNVAAETIAISQHIDGVIFVIKEKGVDRSVIKETIEIIGRDKILGIVFNGSKRRRTKYYYGYHKYRYGYGRDNNASYKF